MRRHAVLIAAISCIAAASLSQAAGTRAAQAGTVAVSILPQAYFVDRIGGGDFKAVVLVGPGQSPHSYEPTPRQMADLARASAWLTIGAEFEKGLLPKVRSLYPALPIVDSTVGIKYRNLEAHRHEGEEAHGDAEAGGEEGPDIHVWLGRQASKAIASNTRDALSRLRPSASSAYSKNCEALTRDIDAVFDSLAKDLLPLKGKPVFVYHPSFGYFLDEFGIAQEAVELGGKEPTQKALAQLIAQAKRDGAKVIFVQAQFPAGAAKTVATAIGGAVETIDPLAPDWLENLGRIGAALRKAAR
jgi:zinc transport system substrate-binding protein